MAILLKEMGTFCRVVKSASKAVYKIQFADSPTSVLCKCTSFFFFFICFVFNNLSKNNLSQQAAFPSLWMRNRKGSEAVR